LEAGRFLNETRTPFIVLGGGSNVLVSDQGVRGVVVLNRARAHHFEEEGRVVFLTASSGANFGSLARQAAGKGFGGLEWAAGIPGTIGGAVVGNAGAHGGSMSDHLVWAEVLAPNGEVHRWSLPDLAYDYRSSVLKQEKARHVVMKARLRLDHRDPGLIREKMDEFLAFRKKTQPPGASMGSMFKNPPGDYAGRLIEQAGLKGMRVGGAQISDLHGNFFINQGGATAGEVWSLIKKSRKAVAEKFGVNLKLEIELVGEWGGHPAGE